MEDKYKKDFRRMQYLMEKMRVMIAKDEVEEWKSVFYGYAKEAKECMNNIANGIEDSE